MAIWNKIKDYFIRGNTLKEEFRAMLNAEEIAKQSSEILSNSKPKAKKKNKNTK